MSCPPVTSPENSDSSGTTPLARVPAADGLEARKATSRSEAARDAELVRRFNSGDESAFDEITTHHREKIFSIALALLRNRSDAEEIAQDTFIRAYRGLARFRGDSSLATWLHHIAVNLSRNRYWYYFRRARHTTLSLDSPLKDGATASFADLLAAEGSSPVREATTTEFTSIVTTCMERLEPSHREILTLRNILNHSYSEIAQALNIEEGTVKSRIARARGRLRSLMAQACPEFSPHSSSSDWFESDRETGLLAAGRP